MAAPRIHCSACCAKPAIKSAISRPKSRGNVLLNGVLRRGIRDNGLQQRLLANLITIVVIVTDEQVAAATAV